VTRLVTGLVTQVLADPDGIGAFQPRRIATSRQTRQTAIAGGAITTARTPIS
jgi:hypothetical protein